jgi:DEAD/DEAH box helicase domain-containing protein
VDFGVAALTHTPPIIRPIPHNTKATMRTIVFDIETSNIFSDVGKSDPSLLNLAIIAIHDSETNKYSSYLQEELGQLWPIIEHADALVGWNSNHFDIPLLNKYYPGELTHIPSIDLMEEVRKSFGRRLKLDAVAQATLKVGKSGHGLQAIQWWQNGEVEKVREYCIQDVAVTKKLFDHARKHGFVRFEELGKKRKIVLDTSTWDDHRSAGITHTLPF